MNTSLPAERGPKGESTAKGLDVENRVVELNDDVSHNVYIEGWKDDYPDKPKPNTASPQVKLLIMHFQFRN